MIEKITEHLANLMSIGLNSEQIAEKGYLYALALQTDQLSEEVRYIPSVCMAYAVQSVMEALPAARRIHSDRSKVR